MPGWRRVVSMWVMIGPMGDERAGRVKRGRFGLSCGSCTVKPWWKARSCGRDNIVVDLVCWF